MTRLHVRYDAGSFPEDLIFIETGDRDNFQGRYILRHPWTAAAACAAAKAYRASLPAASSGKPTISSPSPAGRDEIATR